MQTFKVMRKAFSSWAETAGLRNMRRSTRETDIINLPTCYLHLQLPALPSSSSSILSNMKSVPDASGPVPLEYLEFGGRPNEDVSRFLGDIKRAAVIQGRHSDDEWMVSYAESCLRGDAMEWFDEICSGDTAMDWRTLRKAFLGRFHRRNSDLASISLPAAAREVTASMRPIVREGPNAPLPTSVGTMFRHTQADDFNKVGIPILSIAY
ncbi:hypothetical protein FRB94_012708 [Tulasnella sp. JGI-2019a]|nr:hypothetical protein FRB94_012708 [Tulasnella sp. JGI-2019a]